MQNDHMIRVLGPIDVLTPDGPVAVGGPHARALLGALTIGARHAVSMDHLVFVMWGDEPPTSAHNTVQSYISHLRQVLGAEAVVRVDHSYELLVGPEQIDALVFERLVGDAVDSKDDPDACLEACREALALWRGQPFGDLADGEGFRLEAFRLEELRLVAMELGLSAELSLGHHDMVVGELESAVEEHPYRERLWYLLIEALTRSGRRVEALRACARFRRQLAGAGLEPAEELLPIEQEILRGDR